MKLTSQKILLFSLFLSLFFCLSTQAQTFEKIQIRDGISNFYSKIESQDTIRIVYFGGSITNAPGWRVKSFKWIEEQGVKFSGDWKYPDKKNKLYETESTNASLAFEFEGTMFGIYDWIGPSGTSIDITIDGELQEKMRFDKHCNYNRANYFFIPNLPLRKHKVVIRKGRQISPEEKVEIVKERLNYAEDLRSTFTKNIFRLSKVMVL